MHNNDGDMNIFEIFIQTKFINVHYLLTITLSKIEFLFLVYPGIITKKVISA